MDIKERWNQALQYHGFMKLGNEYHKYKGRIAINNLFTVEGILKITLTDDDIIIENANKQITMSYNFVKKVVF